MELTLDTKENCFLCLQTIAKAEKNALCLKNICRFLQINTSAVLLEGLKEGEGEIDAFNDNLLRDMKCNISVTLCSPCHIVAGKLSSLIHDLELVHLQVNYYSEVFEKILKKADSTSAATEKTRHSETADTRMVDHLRKKAKLKCAARNKQMSDTNRLPLVRLNRLTKETVTTSATLSKKCATVACISPASALNDVGGDISHSENSTVKFDYSESFEIVDDPISTGVSVDAPPKINEDVTEDTTTCEKLNANKLVEKLHRLQKDEKYCISFTNSDPHVFSITGAGANDNALTQLKALEERQLMSCSEPLNPDLPMSYPVVERVVVEDWILVPNTKKSKKSQIVEDPLTCNDWKDDVKIETEIYNDSFTEQQFTQEERHIKKRKIDSEQSLIADQPPNFVAVETVNKRNHTAKTSEGLFACDDCNERFHRSFDLQIHMISTHPEQLFLTYKPAHVSASEFAYSVRKILEVETVGSSYNRKGAVPVKCSYCTVILSYKPCYLRHLAYSHRKIIGKKIRAFEDKVARRPHLREVAKEVKTNDYIKTAEGLIACNHCKSKFRVVNSLRHHMVGRHPDRIFLCYKPRHQSASQFADSCRTIFQRETVGYSNNNNNPAPRQCAYCTEMRRYKQDYLNHLVYHHTKIMGDKIKTFASGGSKSGLADGFSGDTWKELPVVESETCNVGSTNQQTPVTDKSIFIQGEMRITYEERKSESSVFACSHCNNSFRKPDSLLGHMIRAHAGQIFLSVKPAHLSESQFAESCRKVFGKEVVRCSNENKNTDFLECSYCANGTKVRRYYNKSDFLTHLVYSHTNIMREKIRAFENEEARQKRSQGALPGNAGKELQVGLVKTESKERIHFGQTTCGDSSPRISAENDIHNYPVVALQVEELLTEGDWNVEQVEDTVIKTEDCSNSNCVPYLADPLAIEETNSCFTTNDNTIQVSSCDADTKHFADHGSVL